MAKVLQTYKIFITEEEVEKDLTRVDIVELLYNDIATVTFTKVDGSERVMECTLHKDILNDRWKQTGQNDPRLEDETPPALDEKLVKKDSRTADYLDDGRNMEKRIMKSLDTVAVYDVQVEDWRSFRLDSIKSIGFPTTIHNGSGTFVIPTYKEPEMVAPPPPDDSEIEVPNLF
jgi:hypothetical protein|tara:strand:+ start:36 stop:557 length:522 start_codon:yes stop_codon:yes gene_type:complete